MKIVLGVVSTLLIVIGFFAWVGARGLESSAGFSSILAGLVLMSMAVIIDRLDAIIKNGAKPDTTN